MYEEPAAIELVGWVCDGTSVADDYLICPIEAKRFYQSIIPAQGRETGKPVAAVTLDAAGAMKIKQLEKLATRL
jgi:hypothetical protein